MLQDCPGSPQEGPAPERSALRAQRSDGAGGAWWTHLGNPSYSLLISERFNVLTAADRRGSAGYDLRMGSRHDAG